MGKIFLSLCLIGAAAAGIWALTHREPASISEARAREIADDKLLDFCASEKAVCPYFIFQGPQEPVDKRFHWAYPFLDTHAEPWKKVVISVGLKGDSSVEFTTPPSAPDTPGYVAPAVSSTPAPAVPAAAPEAPQESRPR